LASLRKEEPCNLSSTAQPAGILLLDSNSLASMWLMALGMAQGGDRGQQHGVARLAVHLAHRGHPLLPARVFGVRASAAVVSTENKRAARAALIGSNVAVRSLSSQLDLRFGARVRSRTSHPAEFSVGGGLRSPRRNSRR
jgi:hypothetical protein